jgi:hypothetical protein
MPEIAKNAHKIDHFPLYVSKLRGGTMDPWLLLFLFVMFMVPEMTFFRMDPGLVIVLWGIFMVTVGVWAGVYWIVCSWMYKKANAEPDDNDDNLMWVPLPVTMNDIHEPTEWDILDMNLFALDNDFDYDSDACSVARTVREDFW